MNTFNWGITRAQIAGGDVDNAVQPVDPAIILNSQIYGLAGAVQLRVEGVTKPADLFANPQARDYFNKLHEAWPWAGYFLRLHPITIDSSKEQIIDTSLFMALIFCRLDDLTYVETEHGVVLRYCGEQLRHHLTDLRRRAAELASLVGVSGAQIQQRDALIMNAVESFFAAGQAVNQAPGRRRKKQS